MVVLASQLPAVKFSEISQFISVKSSAHFSAISKSVQIQNLSYQLKKASFLS